MAGTITFTAAELHDYINLECDEAYERGIAQGVQDEFDRIKKLPIQIRQLATGVHISLESEGVICWKKLPDNVRIV